MDTTKGRTHSWQFHWLMMMNTALYSRVKKKKEKTSSSFSSYTHKHSAQANRMAYVIHVKFHNQRWDPLTSLIFFYMFVQGCYKSPIMVRRSFFQVACENDCRHCPLGCFVSKNVTQEIRDHESDQVNRPNFGWNFLCINIENDK